MPTTTSLLAVATTILAVCNLGAQAMPLSTNNTASRATSPLEKLHARSANTCADPSLSQSVYLAYTGGDNAHVLGFRWLIANEDSKVSSVFWTLQGEVFKAWQTQQPFTVPLFLLVKPDGSDYIALLGPDTSTPPTASGFALSQVIAWVYNSPVCGSVPLYGLANTAFSDHYYTIETGDRDGLLQAGVGWTDAGIIAYVLPI